MQDVSDKYILLEETEKQALRKALIEDRQRICSFVEMLRPVVVSLRVGGGESGGGGETSGGVVGSCISKALKVIWQHVFH